MDALLKYKYSAKLIELPSGFLVLAYRVLIIESNLTFIYLLSYFSRAFLSGAN
jgi:hypothetical protein